MASFFLLCCLILLTAFPTEPVMSLQDGEQTTGCRNASGWLCCSYVMWEPGRKLKAALNCFEVKLLPLSFENYLGNKRRERAARSIWDRSGKSGWWDTPVQLVPGPAVPLLGAGEVRVFPWMDRAAPI